MSLIWKPSWRFWRRVAQLACLGAFLWLFRRTEFDGFSKIPEASNLLFRLDPLVGASAMLGAKQIIAALAIPGLVLLALTLVLGRFFCGWVCPLGTLLDGARLLVPRRVVRRSEEHRDNARTFSTAPADKADGQEGRARDAAARPGWRRVKYVLLILILASALAGLPLVGYFDPFSILVRGLTTAVDPVLGSTLRDSFDWIRAHVPGFLSSTIESVLGFVETHLLPFGKPRYLLGGISFVILLVVLLLELGQRRFWCRNLCPLGALLSLVARVGLLKRSPYKSCKGCPRCSEDCRMGAFDEEARMAPEACNLCMDCMVDCPHGIVKFGFGRPKFAPAPFEPSRRLFLGTAGAGLVLAAVSRIDGEAAAPVRPRLLRPPGAPDEATFLDLCVRCGLCVKVCPTNALHPAGLEAGWGGAFSPKIVPRIGYCEYNCTLCGEVCPTGALPRLTEEQKHRAIMGKAEFDKNRCLPFARGEPCTVCEEHCPIPDKAIRVNEVQVTNSVGKKVTIQQPYVKIDLCNGCGICETKCPIHGDAGIRVLHSRCVALTDEMVR